MGVEITLQEQGHRTWSIIRLFYLALMRFRAEFESYERLVAGHAIKLGVDREALRLKPQELAELLEFKNLESLRDDFILPLKDLCHLVFRTADQTDWLDRFVSDIFHEISILKEEHYTLKTYAPMYERDSQEVELKYIVDEAHVMFPQKLKHIGYLFGKALERMEQLLPRMRSMPIVIRSLYLHRDDDFVLQAYPGGLRDFYRFIYPLGAFDGYYQVAQSFYHSGFYDQALENFARAEAESKEAFAVFARLKREAESVASNGSADATKHGDFGSSLVLTDPAGSEPLAQEEFARDPRLTLRSLRAKVGRIHKRRLEGAVPDDVAEAQSAGEVSGVAAE